MSDVPQGSPLPLQSPIDGIRFGRYVLQRQIAVGGMAEIFLAKQQGPGRFERSVIIKRILPHLARDPKFVGMFLDEAALAAQLSHPHIAQLFDFGEEQGHYYLALELVRGPDLASIVDACRRLGQPPPTELSVRMVSQMLEALQYAHNAVDEHGQPLRIVHRDVSPQNALVSRAGGVKVIDFGIAKAASAVQKTDAGVVKGKFSYMAPEQLRGEPLDGRCDEYAAGLVLYELLTLQPGLPGEGPGAIAAALEARIVPVEQVRPDLPPALVDVLGRALRPRRDDRFPNCAAMASALEGVLAGAGVVVQDRQVGEYLDRLEREIGVGLSPVGSGSGERVSGPVSAGSGPHDTAISDASLSRARAPIPLAAPAAPPAEPAAARSAARPLLWGVLVLALAAAGVAIVFALRERQEIRTVETEIHEVGTVAPKPPRLSAGGAPAQQAAPLPAVPRAEPPVAPAAAETPHPAKAETARTTRRRHAAGNPRRDDLETTRIPPRATASPERDRETSRTSGPGFRGPRAKRPAAGAEGLDPDYGHQPQGPAPSAYPQQNPYPQPYPY